MGNAFLRGLFEETKTTICRIYEGQYVRDLKIELGADFGYRFTPSMSIYSNEAMNFVKVNSYSILKLMKNAAFS